MSQLAIPQKAPIPPAVTLAAFRSMGDPTDSEVLVPWDFEGADRVTVKARGSGELYDWTASTAAVDRDLDTISAKGWDLRAYKRSPVWLAFHDSSMPEIGVSTEIGVEDERLLSTMRFGPTPMAQSMKQMLDFRIEAKALRDAGGSCSVGFLPKEWKRIENDPARPFGIDFKRQELLEISLVPIGSNRDALRRMKAAGVDLGPVADWAETYRRQESGVLTVDLEVAEAIAQTLAPSCGLKLFTMTPSEVAKVRQVPKEPSEPATPPDPEPVAPDAAKAVADAVAGAFAPLAAGIEKLVEATKSAPAPAPEESTQLPAQEETSESDPRAVRAFLLEEAMRRANRAYIARTGQPLKEN